MKYRLGDVLTIKHGFPFKGEYFSDDGQFIVLTPANFYEKGGFKYTPGKEKYYTHTFPDEYLCNQGDLIVVMTQQAEGLLGSTAFVPEGNRYLHNQRIGLINTNEEVLLPAYADYLFRTKSVREQIRNSASGTKVKHTSPEKIYDVVVDLPSVKIQRLVSNCLSMLEERIKLNQTVCSDLESMAKLLYDYWFVQFDFPDENGKPYKSSGGKMVWNEKLKREIPVKWDGGVLGDVIEKYSDSITSNDSQNLVYTPMESLPMRRMSFSDTADQDDAKSSLVRYKKYSLLFGAMRPYFHRVCIAPFDGITRTTVFTLKSRQEDDLGYAYETLNQDYVVNYANAHHVGTQQPYAEWDNNMENCPIPIPPLYLRKKYSDTIFSLINVVIEKNLENQQLVSLRDYLLPMLMNGQVTVEKAI